MQEDKLLLEQIFISKKTITEMMIDRGYINTNSYLPFNLFYETFKDTEINNKNCSLDLEFVKLNDNNDINLTEIEKNTKFYEEVMSEDNIQNKIYVKYLFNDKKPTEKEIVKKILLQKGFIKENDNILFVHCAGKELSDKVDNIYEHFHISRLLFNITNHKLVPKHELLTKSQVINLKLSMNLKTIYQLPSIQKDDAISKYFNAKVGDVFKIYRNSKTTLEHICYRVVING